MRSRSPISALFCLIEGPSFCDTFSILIAIVGARTCNRTQPLDRYQVDQRNPRTAERALPKGLLSVSNILLFSLASLGIFLLAVYALSPVCQYLWPIVVIPFVVYPYTKRFTWFSHFVLGLCLGLAPIGASIPITNSFTPEPFLIGTAVLCWVAGFDILYAIQDIDFDRRQGLHSIPARFGIKTSLSVTKLLHIASILLLLWVGLRLGLGLFYYMGILIAAGLLAYENSLVKPNDLSRLNIAFFTMNGVISVIMFCFVAIEVMFGRRAIV